MSPVMKLCFLGDDRASLPPTFILFAGRGARGQMKTTSPLPRPHSTKAYPLFFPSPVQGTHMPASTCPGSICLPPNPHPTNSQLFVTAQTWGHARGLHCLLSEGYSLVGGCTSPPIYSGLFGLGIPDHRYPECGLQSGMGSRSAHTLHPLDSQLLPHSRPRQGPLKHRAPGKGPSCLGSGFKGGTGERSKVYFQEIHPLPMCREATQQNHTLGYLNMNQTKK